MNGHKCPGGCGAQVPHHHLACRPCWFRLPTELRDLVNSCYRNRSRDPRAHWEALRLASTWYRDNLDRDPIVKYDGQSQPVRASELADHGLNRAERRRRA